MTAQVSTLVGIAVEMVFVPNANTDGYVAKIVMVTGPFLARIVTVQEITLMITVTNVVGADTIGTTSNAARVGGREGLPENADGAEETVPSSANDAMEMAVGIARRVMEPESAHIAMEKVISPANHVTLPALAASAKGGDGFGVQTAKVRANVSTVPGQRRLPVHVATV